MKWIVLSFAVMPRSGAISLTKRQRDDGLFQVFVDSQCLQDYLNTSSDRDGTGKESISDYTRSIGR